VKTINLCPRNELAMGFEGVRSRVMGKKFAANYAIISSLQKVLHTCEEFLIEFSVCRVHLVSLTCVLGYFVMC